MPCPCRSAGWYSPILELPAARALLELDPEVRARLFAFLSELKATSRVESDRAWLKHKGPIATYRYAIAFHAALLSRAVLPQDSPETPAAQLPPSTTS
jgi:hypothetical protein